VSGPATAAPPGPFAGLNGDGRRRLLAAVKRHGAAELALRVTSGVEALLLAIALAEFEAEAADR
jgi:hypothetical protein